MNNYDTSILKKNISRIMKEKDIKQLELAAETGIPQPQISKVLNCKDSSCFTIQQLVSIAQALHVSTDSILGITPEDSQKEQQEITLSDVCIKLFELDELASVSFSTCKSGEYIGGQNIFDDPIPLETPCIFFENHSIAEFIAEWCEMKKINVQDESLKSNIYTTWKNGSIIGNKAKAKSMRFKDKHKFQMELAGYILEESESPFSSVPLNKDEFEIFKEYMNSGAYTKDYNDYQQKILLDYLNSHNF